MLQLPGQDETVPGNRAHGRGGTGSGPPGRLPPRAPWAQLGREGAGRPSARAQPSAFPGLNVGAGPAQLKGSSCAASGRRIPCGFPAPFQTLAEQMHTALPTRPTGAPETPYRRTHWRRAAGQRASGSARPGRSRQPAGGTESTGPGGRAGPESRGCAGARSGT